jgi:hypothetical protein
LCIVGIELAKRGIYTLARSHDHGSMPKSEIADASTLTLTNVLGPLLSSPAAVHSSRRRLSYPDLGYTRVYPDRG